MRAFTEVDRIHPLCRINSERETGRERAGTEESRKPPVPYAASSPTRKDFAAERAISSGDLLSSLPSPSLSALFSSWQQQQQRVCACVCVREGASVLPLRASRPRSTLVVLGGGVGVAVVVVAVISYEEDGELSWSCRVASTSIVPTTNETDTPLSHIHIHKSLPRHPWHRYHS